MSLKYNKAISQLLSLADFERKSRANDPPDFHLKRVQRLLHYLGNPHQGQKYIHVAGSKGKGSTSALIAWSLAGSGYKTGLFTSPSIHKITERFRINGIPISENEFSDLINTLWPAVEQVTTDGDIGLVSVFELETAMAFCHFAKAGVDISVIEVGLGGRLDSTNIITPLVSVITPISLDHVKILGGTIELIAGEKAGIIKPGIPVVLAAQEIKAYNVICSTAHELKSNVVDSESIVKIVNAKDLGLDGVKLEFIVDKETIRSHLKLLGAHQVDNFRTAMTVLKQLNDHALPIDFAASAAHIKNIDWPGRNQLVTHASADGNAIFVDGAHNNASARALCESVQKLFPERNQTILIIGIIGGHDPVGLVEELMPLKPKIIVTESRHPKSLTNFNLSETLYESKIIVTTTTTNTIEALAKAKSMAQPGDLIIATGSLFVAAEIIEIEHNLDPEIYPDINPSRQD